MKVNIGEYRHRWVSYVHDRYMDKKYGGWGKWEDNSTRFESFLEKVEDGLQWLYNHSINLYLDKRPGQKIKVRIDPWDTWSMDHTLASIIVPMLKQLKETKHGAPAVEFKDVPEELHPPEGQTSKLYTHGKTDDNYYKRWDWVLDEMIYAFDCKANKDEPYMRIEDIEEIKKEQQRISNGFRLFGKYYESLWD